MPLDPQRIPAVMCLTQDGLGVSHASQVARLCAAGAGWIQLRMKAAPLPDWKAEAVRAVAECRRHGAVLIVNDSVDVALDSGADGVHLGSLDGAWAEARRRLGPGALIGGTVNTSADARRALEAGCLDYVGVGPLRFTATKLNLSPVLGLEGIRRLVRELAGLPAWAIGGVTPADLPGLRLAGAAGVAVSSFLYRGGPLEANLLSLLDAWGPREPADRHALLS
jgi:thiamine-phosphate pyrophosphorylase